VAQHLEGLGHEVIVADPNYAAMYATRSRRVKTDRRDARTLADACRLGAFHPTHRTSAAQREVRAELAVREALVRTRTRYLSVIRALLRREGIRVPSGSAAAFAGRLAAVPLSPTQQGLIAPLVALLTPLNAAIAAGDARVARRLAADPVARRLATTPGAGPVTAVAFRATLDDVTRFARAGQVAAYLGLVPQEHSSGERQRRGALTKAGNTRLRWLLVQAGWGIWRDRHAASLPVGSCGSWKT
jgi:transposase